MTKVRLVHDPAVQHCYKIQRWEDMGICGGLWKTLVAFQREELAWSAFAAIEKHGVGMRVLREIEVG